MLEFLGILFLVITGLVAAFFTWLFFKVKSGVQQQANVTAIEQGMETPAIELRPVEQLSLVRPDAIAELVDQAIELGASTCGNYDVPAAGARLSAYTLDNPPVYIIICDHDQVDPWTDVVLRLGEDSSFTASTVPEIARGAPRHPDDEIMYFAPGTMTGVLVQAATERAKGDAALPATAEAFRTYFEAAARKSQEYIQTQAVSQEWLSAIAEDAGVELTGGEAAQINFARAEQQAMQTEIDCLRTLAESGDFTAAQWDELRDELVAVWDDMPGEHVSAVFYNHVDVPMELESAVDELEDGNGLARERVARFNAALPEAKRLVLVGSVTSPVAADIYRSRIPCV